jgi:hypothetical protein
LTGIGGASAALIPSASTVTVGTPVNITWSGSRGTTCMTTGGRAGDGWAGLGGAGQAGGSISVTESTAATYTYGLTCVGGGQTAHAQVSVVVGQPTVSLSATPTSVVLGHPTTLTWTSTNVASCSASGGASGDSWAGTKPTNGSAAVAENVAGTVSYTITCVSGLASAVAVTTVQVTNPPSSGGGAFDPLSLLSLLALFGLRRRTALSWTMFPAG